MTKTGLSLAPLSELLCWTVDHFFEIAAYLDAVADEWENSYATIGNDAHALDWAGASAEAARARITSDTGQIFGGAERLRVGARAARAGASDVHAAQNRLRYAVEDAITAGFDVGDDYSVHDAQPSADPNRWAEAEQLAAALHNRATDLAGVDASVGDRAQAAVSEIAGHFRFIEVDEATPDSGHVGAGVQPVGHGTRPPAPLRPPRAPDSPGSPPGDVVGADGGAGGCAPAMRVPATSVRDADGDAVWGPVIMPSTPDEFPGPPDGAFAEEQLNTGIGHAGDFINKSAATAAEYATIPHPAPALGPTQPQLNQAAERGAQTWRSIGGVGKNLGRLGYGMEAANGIIEFQDAVKHGSSITDATVDVVPKTVAGTAGAYAGAIVGAEYGAGIGAAAGTVIPGPGTAAGAAIGAGVGAVAGGIAGSQVGKIAGEAASRIWHVVVD